jgi:hypothetical protein
MWVFLSDAFLSIVSAADRPDDLLVRGRKAGDIQRVFPRARVSVTPQADYRFRAFVARTDVAAAIAAHISGIDYTNFKDSVPDSDRHHAYSAVWLEMYKYQIRNLPPAPPRKTAPKRSLAVTRPKQRMTRFLRRGQ